MKNLTDKQRLFIDAYMKTLNATQAAIAAGYSERTAHVIGHENLRKPKIREIIDDRLAKQVISPGETMARLSDHASSSMADFLRVDGHFATINLEKAQAAGKLHLLKKFKATEKGLEIELYDKQDALKTLARVHGLLNADVNINVNIELIVQAIGAMEKVGLNPAEVFENIIREATTLDNSE